MTEEFTNLLRLIRGDEAQFELGMQIATNYQTEFEEYFGCTIGQARNLFPFLFLCAWNFEGSILDIVDLRCEHKGLTTLPAEIGLLQNLTELYCYGNKLTTFPIEIGQLQNLRHLDCENNLFSDSEIEQIKKLLPSNCEARFYY